MSFTIFVLEESPPLLQSSSLNAGSLALNITPPGYSAIEVMPLPKVPLFTSFNNTVPEAVPSLTHNSLPTILSLAEK